MADFDLVVLTPTTKLPNLIPGRIFQLYSIQGLGQWSKHTHQSESHQSATTTLACRVTTQDASHTPSPSFLYPPHPHIYLSHEEHNQYNGQEQVVPSCLEVPVVSCHADSPMGLLLGNWSISKTLRGREVRNVCNIHCYTLVIFCNLLPYFPLRVYCSHPR